MKILHAVLSQGFYGSERYCIDLAIAQARAGHGVAVIIQDGRSPCAQQYRKAVAEASSDGLKGTIRIFVIPRVLPALLHRPVIRQMLQRFGPDVVHTHLNPAARRVGRTAQSLGVPHVSTLHLNFDAPEHGACDGLILVNNFQRAMIASEFVGEVTVAWTALPSAHIKMLAHTSPEEVAKLRQSWSADDSTRVFGTIGRLMPEKGIDRLVLAFRTAFPKGNEAARLVILGAGQEEANIRGLADGDPRIFLVGTQDEVAPFYLAFDVYTNTARFEPFGLTVLEAMAAGCKLVLTRTDGPGHYARGDHVLIAEQNDDAALPQMLRVAAGWPRTRPTYDVEEFSQQRITGLIEEHYRTVVAKRRSTSRNAK
jgi:glycosyltransferase involved in cell wall biosynthesis